MRILDRLAIHNYWFSVLIIASVWIDRHLVMDKRLIYGEAWDKIASCILVSKELISTFLYRCVSLWLLILHS